MKIFKNILPLFVAILFITSCDKRELDIPIIEEPVYNGEANMTIQEFKNKYAGQALVKIDTAIIIRGLVTANDISGNIYNQIQLQDETGGICITIERASMFTVFSVGQEVFVECKGLYYGEYGGYPQLGYTYTNPTTGVTAIGRIAWFFFRERAHLNGFPRPELVKPVELRIGQINNSHVGKLVTVRDVYFERGGEPFAEPGPDGSIQTQSKMLASIIAESQKLTARNSSAANFAFHLMPDKNSVGSVTGVLSTYYNAYQITFRDSLDVSPTRFYDGRGGGTGETADSPLSVRAGIVLQTRTSGNLNTMWVKGYIVGYVKNGVTAVNSESNVVLGFISDVDAPPQTNILIADDPNETDYLNCIFVELPSGTPLRTNVNLYRNPNNLGKVLTVQGTLTPRYSLPGSRFNTGYDFILSNP